MNKTERNRADAFSLNKIKNPPAKPKDFYGGDGRT